MESTVATPPDQSGPQPTQTDAAGTTEKQSRRDFWALVVMIYLFMVLFGMAENVKTVVFPMIKKYYDLSGKVTGLLVSISGYGYCVNCLMGLILIKLFGVKKILVTGAACLLIGALSTTFVKHYGWLFLTLLIMYLSFGLFEVSTNILATGLFTENTAVMMTLMHFFYGLGAILAPYVTSGMIHWLNVDFKSVYYLLVAFAVILIVVPFFIRFNLPNLRHTNTMISLKDTLKIPLVWYMTITLGFMELLELGTSDWAGIYFHDVYGMDPTKEGALFATIFFAVFTAGRLLSGYAIEKCGYFKFLYFSLSATFVIMISGFIAGRYGLYILPLTGAFIGLNWPIMFSIGIKIFKEDAPVIASVILVVAAGLNNVFELLIGFINDGLGPEWGYRCLSLTIPIAIGLLYIIQRKTRDIDFGGVPKAGSIEEPLLQEEEEGLTSVSKTG